MTSIDVNLTSKMIENAQNRQFLSCKWPQYHFSMVFMMVYIDFCSLLMCQMNIYCDSTHIDVNWRQFDVEMIENAQNCQFLSCRWPQYHFSMVFIMFYIDFFSLFVSKMITFSIKYQSCRGQLTSIFAKNDRKYAKSTYF